MKFQITALVFAFLSAAAFAGPAPTHTCFVQGPGGVGNMSGTDVYIGPGLKGAPTEDILVQEDDGLPTKSFSFEIFISYLKVDANRSYEGLVFQIQSYDVSDPSKKVNLGRAVAFVSDLAPGYILITNGLGNDQSFAEMTCVRK